MPTVPAELWRLIIVFAPLFTKPAWKYARGLLLRALFAPGTRTFTFSGAVIAVCGRG